MYLRLLLNFVVAYEGNEMKFCATVFMAVCLTLNFFYGTRSMFAPELQKL